MLYYQLKIDRTECNAVAFIVWIGVFKSWNMLLIQEKKKSLSDKTNNQYVNVEYANKALPTWGWEERGLWGSGVTGQPHVSACI